LLSAGFSLIFGLMRIANLTHGGAVHVGAYYGSHPQVHSEPLVAALLADRGGRFAARRTVHPAAVRDVLGQVLVTLGIGSSSPTSA